MTFLVEIIEGIKIKIQSCSDFCSSPYETSDECNDGSGTLSLSGVIIPAAGQPNHLGSKIKILCNISNVGVFRKLYY